MKTWFGLILALWSADVLAHKASDSYLTVTVADGRVSGRWDLALRDLDDALGLDADDDGAITWGELRARRADIESYALGRLALGADGRNCALEPADFLVDEHTDGKYAVLNFTAACGPSLAALTVDYRLFFDLDPQHRGLLRLTAGGESRTAVLGPDDGSRRFDLAGGRDPWRDLRDFLREGIRHIGTGYDHLLFLLSLLLPAVLVRESAGWRRIGTFRAAAGDVVKVVTAFTLAHSLTLSLAALGWLELPSRWVESAIAASVVLAALNNLVPVLHRRRARLAFGFGLVHGLGFAAVLADLGLPQAARLWSLLGFNLGVEAGQLGVVGLFLPVAYGLSRFRLYESAVLKTGSAGIAVLAGVWLLERALDVRIGLLFG